VFSDAAERVLSVMLFHADVAEAAKARPPIVAWGPSINDVTQFYRKIDSPSPLSHLITNLGPPTKITSQA